MKAFCEYNDYEIAGEYEDAGKSGKSIEGRIQFNRMLEDIKSGKDVSNRKADSYVKLNVKMEDYYRIKDAEKKTDE